MRTILKPKPRMSSERRSDVEARLISQWLETRRVDWVKVSQHWKLLANTRLARQFQKQLGQSKTEATAYVAVLDQRYRTKGWIR